MQLLAPKKVKAYVHESLREDEVEGWQSQRKEGKYCVRVRCLTCGWALWPGTSWIGLGSLQTVRGRMERKGCKDGAWKKPGSVALLRLTTQVNWALWVREILRVVFALGKRRTMNGFEGWGEAEERRNRGVVEVWALVGWKTEGNIKQLQPLIKPWKGGRTWRKLYTFVPFSVSGSVLFPQLLRLSHPFRTISCLVVAGFPLVFMCIFISYHCNVPMCLLTCVFSYMVPSSYLSSWTETETKQLNQTFSHITTVVWWRWPPLGSAFTVTSWLKRSGSSRSSQRLLLPLLWDCKNISLTFRWKPGWRV